MNSKLRSRVRVMGAMGLIILTLLACEKADSRAQDLELEEIAKSLPAKAWEENAAPICASFSKNEDGFMSVQEIIGDRSISITFRYGMKENSPLGHYILKALQIRTEPEQIGWHARLEEEIESWEGVIEAPAQPTAPPTLLVGQMSENKKLKASELKVFLTGMETSLGALHTLSKWCSPKEGTPRESDFRLKLGKTTELKLEPGDTNSAQLSVGEKLYDVTASKKGIQWLHSSESSQLIIRHISANPVP